MLALVPPWMHAEGDDDRVARVDRAGHELIDAVDELDGDARSGRRRGAAAPRARPLPGSRPAAPGRRRSARPGDGRSAPTPRSGSTCSATIARTSSTAPASIISIAPSPTSSAGWKIARQATGPGQGVAALPEGQGRRQGHGRMRIVAAGVHDAVAARAVRDGLGVVDSQGVDIGPERDQRLARGVRGSGDSPRPVGAIARKCRRLQALRPDIASSHTPRGSVPDFECRLRRTFAHQVPPRLHGLVNRDAPVHHRQSFLQGLRTGISSILQMAAAVPKAGRQQSCGSFHRVIRLQMST